MGRSRHIQQFEGIDLRPDLAELEREEKEQRRLEDGLNEFLWAQNDGIPRPDADMLAEMESGDFKMPAGAKTLDYRPDRDGPVVAERLPRDPRKAPEAELLRASPGAKLDVAESRRDMAPDVTPRKPLVHQGPVDSKVVEFVKEKMQPPDSKGAELRKRAVLFDALDGDRSEFGNMLRGEADRQDEAVRRFVLETRAKEDKDAQRSLEAMRYADEQKRRAGQDARQSKLDALNEEESRASIAKTKAETERANRRNRGPGGGVGPMSEEKALKMEILRNNAEKGRQAVTGEDPEKLKKAEASLARLKGLTAQLRDIHKRKGTELGGQAAQQMNQLMTEIRLEAKNVAELGALSGPDAKLMEELSGADPSSLGANAKALIGIDNTQSALDGLDKWADTTTEAARSVYGSSDKRAPGLSPAEKAGVPVEKGPVNLDQAPKKEKVINGVRYIHDGKGWKRE